MALIAALPVKSLASPELTGAWEARLARIARGAESRVSFMTDIARYVRDTVAAIRVAEPSRELATAADALDRAPARPAQSPRARKPRAAAAKPGAARKPRAAGKPRAAARPISELTCPGCHKGALLAGRRGWGCTRWREGCRFVVWFETAGRRLTEGQLRDLILRGKTRRARFCEGGRTVEGRLVLEAAAGGVRLVPASDRMTAR
jgi:DNA topoisomerase-3